MPRSPASLARHAATAFVVLLALGASTTLVSAARQPDALAVKPGRQLSSVCTVPMQPSPGTTCPSGCGNVVADIGVVALLSDNLNITVTLTANVFLPAGTKVVLYLDVSGGTLTGCTASGVNVVLALSADVLNGLVNVGALVDISASKPAIVIELLADVAAGQAYTVPLYCTVSSLLGSLLGIVVNLVGAVLCLV